MPKHRAAVVGRLVQRLVVKQLQVGAEQILHAIENLVVEQQAAEMQVAFDICMICSICSGASFFFRRSSVSLIDRLRNCASPSRGAGELAVVLAAQQVNQAVIEQPAELQVSVVPEAVHLLGAEPAEPVVSPMSWLPPGPECTATTGSESGARGGEIDLQLVDGRREVLPIGEGGAEQVAAPSQ